MADTREKSILKNIPDWLRWILVLPAATIGLISTYTIVAILRHSVNTKWGHLSFAQLLIGLFGSFLSAILFVNFGAVMAPKKKYAIAKIMAMTFLILTFAKLYDLWRWRLESHIPWPHVLAASIVGVLAAVLSASFYHRQEQVYQNNAKRFYTIDRFE